MVETGGLQGEDLSCERTDLTWRWRLDFLHRLKAVL